MTSIPTYRALNKYTDLTSGDIMPYTAKAQSIETADQIGYHRLNEAAGAVAFDLSPAVNDGDYANVTLGQAGIGDGETCPLFNGTTSEVDLANVIPDFDPGYFTINVWAKLGNVAYWIDGSQDNIIAFTGDVNNTMYICKSVGNNTVGYRYEAGGIDTTVHKVNVSTAGWFVVGLTVDLVANIKRNFFNGVQMGADQADFGTWGVGVLTMLIGANWNGLLAHALIINKPTSVNNMARLARLN